MNPLAADLDHVLAHTRGLWEELRGQRIFITGGTGFFGCWLLESLVWAIEHGALETEAVVLTRDPKKFRQKAPHLAGHSAIKLQAGDVRDFAFPSGQFSHVIHAATEASAKLNEEDPLLMLDTIVHGTRRTLDFAVQAGTRKFLFISSGAVYGAQPAALTHIPEDYTGAPVATAAQSAYGEGKRLSELLCALYSRQQGLETRIARCFAFVGPHLPLEAHYAIGNFIRDALRGGPIRISGDGTPSRSYLYAADLAIWLWTILFRGATARAYNVGSEVSLTVGEVAQAVSSCFTPPPKICIAQTPDPSRPPLRYVPSIRRAQTELGLAETFRLTEAISRTFRWHRG